MNGTIRVSTITEQLKRNQNFVGINDIKHPIHGIIDVDRMLDIVDADKVLIAF